jgi:uncharacterized protein YbjT (DUF2867 family)
MTILVTGGTGFIGSHIAKQLLAAGEQVRLLVRSPEKAQQLFGNVTDLLDIARGILPIQLRLRLPCRAARA